MFERISLKEIYFGEIDGNSETKKDGGLFLKTVTRDLLDLRKKITEDQKIFLIGRKGSGKSTFANWLNATRSDQDIVLKIPFSCKNLDKIIQTSNEQGNEFIWEWIYLCNFLSMVYDHGFLDIEESDLKKIEYFINQNRGFCSIDMKEVTKYLVVNEGKVSLSNAKFLNLDFLSKSESSQQRAHFTKLIQPLKDFLINTLSSSKSGRQNNYFIIVDELDNDFDGANLIHQKGIISLLQTTKALYELFSSKLISFYPIVLIRPDMLEPIQKLSTDGRKFGRSGNGLEITWYNQDEFESGNYLLKDMVSKRIEYSYGKNSCQIPKGRSGWDFLVKSQSSSDYDLFKYLLNMTRYCPRDIIAYLNIIKEKRVSKDYVDKKMIDEAFGTFARDTWDEWQNELSSFLSPSEIADLETGLRDQRGSFSLEIFTKSLSDPDEKYAKKLLLQAYSAGMICNYPNYNFSYRFDSNEIFNIRGKLQIHKILYALWGIELAV